MRCPPHAREVASMSPRTPLLNLAGVALLGAVVGVLAAAPAQAAAPVSYVALGDSYSAGVGAGGYEASSGLCSRSPRSYTALWAGSHTVASFTSVACGGATTTDV